MYTVNSPELPEKVKALPKRAREIWVRTFNNVYRRNGNKDDGPAGNAYAIAWHAVNNYLKRQKNQEEDLQGQASFLGTSIPLELEFELSFELEEGRDYDPDMPAWIPVHMLGEYKHPWYGKFTFTEEKAMNAIANFYSCRNRPRAPLEAQVPVDTRHRGDEACGWLEMMRLEGDYLVAKVNWTSLGKKLIKERYYRFISPAYVERDDDVIIKEVALTNRDFLRMPPVEEFRNLSFWTTFRPPYDSDGTDTHFTSPGNSVWQISVTPLTTSTVVKLEGDDNKDDKERAMIQLTEETFGELSPNQKINLYYALAFEDDLPESLVELAKWTRAFINTLPDAAFAVIEPAYKQGKTENKNARHLPHHNKNVKDPNEDKSVDITHYRNARARANQIKPVTDSISTEELRRRAWAHLRKHEDVLKRPEQAKQKMKQEAEPMDSKLQEYQEKYSALEGQYKELLRKHHELLVGRHLEAATERGVPPVIVNALKPILLALNPEAERTIELEEGKEKVNIFEALVKLLEDCPGKLGAITEPPKESPRAESKEDNRLEELKEGEELAKKLAKEHGLFPVD